MKLRQLKLRNTRRSDANRIVRFYNDNSVATVFPRSLQRVKEAASEQSAIHLEDASGKVHGVCMWTRDDFGCHDIGGVRVTLNGYGFQTMLMRTNAVMARILEPECEQITATCFADNIPSIRSIEKAGFTLWKSAPTGLLAKKEAQADGRPYRLYHATESALQTMAQELISTAVNPVFRSVEGSAVTVAFQCPIFTTFREALRELADDRAISGGKRGDRTVND